MVAYDANEPPSTPLRVLLVDGNAVDREFLGRAIQCCSAVQLHALSGVAEALSYLGETRPLPHVIFTELALRDLPAPEMLHWIRHRREFASVWLVAVTGEMKLAVRPADYYGADALLVKPVSPADLAAVLALSANARSRMRPAASAGDEGL